MVHVCGCCYRQGGVACCHLASDPCEEQDADVGDWDGRHGDAFAAGAFVMWGVQWNSITCCSPIGETKQRIALVELAIPTRGKLLVCTTEEGTCRYIPRYIRLPPLFPTAAGLEPHHCDRGKAVPFSFSSPPSTAYTIYGGTEAEILASAGILEFRG